MTPRELADRLGLRRSGRGWRGSCPSCGYADAFAIDVRDGRALGWCASCQDRETIGNLMRGNQIPASHVPPERRGGSDVAARREASQARALSLWASGEPVPGTIAEGYLARRHVAHIAVSPALRFRADCAHPNDSARHPALLALVQDAAGEPIATHRTYLARDGRKASLEPAKASLGPVLGGAIRFDCAAPELVIGEGIETAASAGLLLGLPAWAALSAGNLAGGVVLPGSVRAVVIAADADPPGQRAAEAAALRWQAEGRRVRIACPDVAGADFADVLRVRMEADHAA